MKNFLKRITGLQSILDGFENVRSDIMMVARQMEHRAEHLGLELTRLSKAVELLAPRPYVIIEGKGVESYSANPEADKKTFNLSWGKHATERLNCNQLAVQFNPQHVFKLESVLSLGPFEIVEVKVGNRSLMNYNSEWPSMHRWTSPGGDASTAEVGNLITVVLAPPGAHDF